MSNTSIAIIWIVGFFMWGLAAIYVGIDFLFKDQCRSFKWALTLVVFITILFLLVTCYKLETGAMFPSTGLFGGIF